MSNFQLNKIVVGTCFFSLIIVSAAFSQSFDYETRPQLNFKFSEATIDLQLNPEEDAIRGSVEYRLKANISGADSLSIQAARLQIDSVYVEGQNAGFEMQDGQLRIAMTDSSEMGQPYRVEIYYHGSPRFGLLKSAEGSVWTSLLSLSNRHWLPVADHPAVSFTSTLSLTVPTEYTVAASGVQTDEEALGNGNKRVTYRTGRPVPATAISFAVGRFNEEGLSYGIKRINSYAEPLSVAGNQQRELVQQAEQIIRQVENATKVEYPFQRLQIIVLNDHHWEQKPYGASTIFLYKNRGDLVHQLRRGIYAQWFGVYQREVQWANAWPMNFFQTALHFNLSDEPAVFKKADIPETDFATVYDNFGVENWNFWQHYNTWDRLNLKQTAQRIIPQILARGNGAFTPKQYEDIWYAFSGQPVIDVPSFEPMTNSSASAESDSIRYQVDYNLAPSRQNVQLIFTAQQGVMNESVSLPIEIISGGEANASSVSFAGSTDTVDVSLPAGTQNIQLNVPADQKLVLDERKPVPFLLYQLRNAETVEARRKAAEQIGYHSENPDLQLALDDFMDQSMEPEVEAALLRSFGDITNGATGTQKRFLDALSNENAEIRAAALDVLKNYEDPTVAREIRTFSENESNTELANRALNIYLQRVDSSAALQFTNTLVQQDTAGTKAIVAIAALAEQGSTEKAVELAGFYIEPVYAYPVRKQAFQILLSNDTLTDNWEKRTEMLLNDYDPRIRFLAIKSIQEIPGIDAQTLLSSQMEKEYDARVFGVLSRE